jgi:hypothetical protein
MCSHGKRTGREQRSVGSAIGAPTPRKSGGEGEETDEGWRGGADECVGKRGERAEGTVSGGHGGDWRVCSVTCLYCA